jgi:excisionase family DNA binding protein
MSRMFCTLQEAAQTLHTSEDQIDALLARGLLPEFREGRHRLLREADVRALAQVRRRKTQDGGRDGAWASTPALAPARRSRRSEKTRARKTGVATRTPQRAPRDSPPPGAGHPASMRQWFWMGLIQDRPLALALLAGLTLLTLSALVAAACLLAETH